MIRYYIPWKNENSGFLFSEDIKVKHSLKMRQQSFVNLDRVVLVFKHFKNMSQLLLFCQHTFSDKASRKHVNNFRIKPPSFIQLSVKLFQSIYKHIASKVIIQIQRNSLWRNILDQNLMKTYFGKGNLDKKPPC